MCNTPVSIPIPGLDTGVLGSDVVRFIGEADAFLGEEKRELVNERRVSRRLEARIIARRTSRAWRPRLWILATVSLLLGPAVLDVDVVAGAADGTDGVYAFKAARTCFGVVIAAGEERRASSEGLSTVMARSMAPRSTSNRLRTSPVRAATFLVKSMRVGAGSNFLISAVV